MSFKPSRRSNIDSFRALDILRELAERTAAGEDIVSLSPGQPSRGAPDAALAYASKVLENDTRQGYTAAIGMDLLRDRIAVFYRERYGIELDYARVAMTMGSSGAFVMAFTAAFDAGDTVALIAPTYPAYRNILKSLAINVIEIEASAASNYQPTAELLENCGEKFDGLIICSPSNPTGTMIEESELEKICKWCDARKVRLISDEAYHGITYERPAQTALKFSDTAIITNTFSKYFAMTGWRLGWVVLPEDLTDRFKKLAENLFVSPPTLAQHLAYKIFDHIDELDEYVKIYRRNRDILKKELPKIGFDSLSAGQGAFYLYADIHNLTNDSESFCRRMMDEAKVAMTPGLDFDLGRGHATVRISYAGSTDDMHKACERLAAWKK